MKNKVLVFAIIAGILLMGCSNNADPSATSNVSIKMSATTSTGKSSFNGRTQSAIALTDVKVNIRDIEFEFDHEDEHFMKDSSYNEDYEHEHGMMGNHHGNDDNEKKLAGPFIVDLMNAGTFVDQVITTLEVPNAKYEKIKFKLAPSTETGDMQGKSVLITGTIESIPFEFWHNRKAKFGVKFSDSTSMAATGDALTLSIQLELDKVLSTLNGGVDLTKAVDGNKDGTITIDPINTDGNKNLANEIMMLLNRRMYCDKRKD